MNHITTRNGKKKAVCQCCGKQSRATEPDWSDEPDLWKLGRGWSEAPYPAGYEHDDGSVGSRYTCPACNSLLRAGHRLRTSGGQRLHDAGMSPAHL